MLEITVQPLESNNSTLSYSAAREKDVKLLKSLLTLHGIDSVEYSVTDNWVRIKGITINGISREDVEECYEKLKNKKGSSKTND